MPTSTSLNNLNTDTLVDGPDFVRTTLLNNDFDYDADNLAGSRFDCKVVLSDIFSENSTVKCNLLKLNQDKTHSVLSQRFSEKMFLETLKRKDRITWPTSADADAWSKLDHLVMNDLLKAPANLSIQERVDNLESVIYNKASILFGLVPPPRKGLGGKNRRAHLSINLVVKKNNLINELETTLDHSNRLNLLGLLDSVKAQLRSMRKGERKRKFRWKKKQANLDFKKNPFLAGKKVLDPKIYVNLSVDKESMDEFKSSVVFDDCRNIPLPTLEGLPSSPTVSKLFDSSMLSFSEFSSILHSRRNGSSPGINMIPYKIYKLCPNVCDYLFRLFKSCF